MWLQTLSSAGSQRLLAQPARCFRPFRSACRQLSVRPRATETATAVTIDPAAAPAFKANLDFKYIKENLAAVTENCKHRFSSAQPVKVVELYDEFTRLKQEADRVRASRNENSQAMKGKLEPEQRQQLIEKGQQLKVQLEGIESQLAQVENQLQVEGQRVPNNTHPSVPLGGEENAALLKEVGSQRAFGFTPKDHVTLGESLGLLDFESAAEVSGSKFYYLRNAAALLELALVNWSVSKVVARGFTPLITPDLVKESVLEKCGFQPRADNTQVYSVKDSPLCLTGTAEVPLGGVYMDKVLNEKDLPVKMVAYGHCFRTEAGAAGMAGKGLYRVHQFSKVEMFVLATPQQSEALHQELIDIEAGMFEELGLHFKVLDMPSGDLGAPAYRKFDVEAWMPGLGRYGEISSASNCTDYQSRRLNIRYRPNAGSSSSSSPDSSSSSSGGNGKGKGKPQKQKGGSGGATQYVHTLNATACAVPRMIVAILENFQQEDGSVVVPEVLRPYMGGLEVIQPPQQ